MANAKIRAKMFLACTVVAAPCVLSMTIQEKANGARQSAAPLPNPVAQRLRDEVKTVEAVLPRLVDRGAALFLLAHHYARLGEQAKALELLKECVALDEGFSPGAVRAFEPLRSNAEFQNLVEQVRQKNSPVRRARIAFTLRQNDLFPEGLAADVSKHVFYMGSEYHNKIVKISDAGEVTDFVKEGIYDLMPVGGVHVDPADRSIWCATDPGDKNRSEIVHFDTRGRLLERYRPSAPGSHTLNDLALHSSNDIFVTDTDGNRVFRFDRNSHRFEELDLRRPLIGPNGITVSDDGNALYVADDLGVIRVDLRTKDVQDVKPTDHDTMAGVDGLYWYKGSLLGVQYGTGAYRVMRWRLSPDGRKVKSSEVLERGTEMVRDPTTGAILDGKFYFMANTGIENLRHGTIADPAKLEPLQIAVLSLE